MIDLEKAKSIAAKHIANAPSFHPDYTFIVDPQPLRLKRGWRFDYVIQCLRDIPEPEWARFGGAPGYLVGHDGTVGELSWGAYQEIENEKGS